MTGHFAGSHEVIGPETYVILLVELRCTFRRSSTMVWALPFSWYVPGWRPVQQGLHPSTYENGEPDHDADDRACTGASFNTS